jgi:hypothetical protein
MQAPFHITGDSAVDWIILIVGAVVCLYWLRALRLAREGARRWLQNFAIAVLIFVACRLVLTRTPMRGDYAFFISIFLPLTVFYRRASTKRSRHIRKSVKRAVVARDLKGEEYDPAKHHIDHVWPFSKGGSHTADNLRVISKEQNLKKGAKRPRLREMW